MKKINQRILVLVLTSIFSLFISNNIYAQECRKIESLISEDIETTRKLYNHYFCSIPEARRIDSIHYEIVPLAVDVVEIDTIYESFDPLECVNVKLFKVEVIVDSKILRYSINDDQPLVYYVMEYDKQLYKLFGFNTVNLGRCYENKLRIIQKSLVDAKILSKKEGRKWYAQVNTCKVLELKDFRNEFLAWVLNSRDDKTLSIICVY